jgi:prolyl-tRNA synthetase
VSDEEIKIVIIGKNVSKTAINPSREDNFAEWYQQIIQAAELAENSPVRGCMVLKPYGYAIWENIQKIFDVRLKKIGVQNAYFPLLVPLDFLNEEAEHVDGFAKECAVVTHHRLKKDDNGCLVPDGKLESPYVIRPTSETIIGKIVSKWIKTYRDLPLKLNQWCNVMRWEMRPRLFLRTSEFLWQEGHTIFETEQEATRDALEMLDLYYDLIEGDLAMPAIKGEKTNEEKFPGAKNTYTIEVMMQDGKALQAGTSHYLGQTFSKAFDIKYVGKDNKEHLTFTSSWGISTRLIGGIIMSHADDDGLILPPSIAPYQVVIIPILYSQSITKDMHDYCSQLQAALDDFGVRSHIDYSDNSNSDKIWKWIKKGVPIRIEIGPKELSNNALTLIRRDIGKASKVSINIQEIESIGEILKDISNCMRIKAKSYKDQKIKEVFNLEELQNLFSEGFKGFALINKSLTEKEAFFCIAKNFALSRRCIPFDNLGTKPNKNISKVLVSKSY